MGKQSKLKKLKRECRAVVNENNVTKNLDQLHKEALVDEVYRKSKKSFLNASTDSRLSTPKQGLNE